MWWVQVSQLKDSEGGPSGRFQLTAESDEGGGFHAGCDHHHASGREAANCMEAKEYLGRLTGFPLADDEDE